LENIYRVWPFEFTRTSPSFVLLRETVPLAWVALRAIEPATRNPTTPSIAVNVSMTTMRLADSRAATRPPLSLRSISFMMQLLSSLFYARGRRLDSRNRAAVDGSVHAPSIASRRRTGAI
jgi:hypothetical protein